MIVSGNSGIIPNGVCWSHDDCSSLTSPLNPLGTDDLITLSVTGSSNNVHGSNYDTSNVHLPSSSRSPFDNNNCDDEDNCKPDLDSGSGDGDLDMESNNNHGWDKKDEDDLIDKEGSRSGSSGSSTIKPFDPWPTSITFSFPTPTLYPPSFHPPQVINYYQQSTTEDFSQILHTFKPIPPPKDTITSGSVEQSYRPKTLRPSIRPAIVDVPKPSRPLNRDPKGSSSGPSTPATPTYAAPDRTALLIGLIAVLIIVIVIIAPLFLYVRIKYKDSLQVNGQALLNGTIGKNGPPNGYQFVQVAGPNRLMAVNGRTMVGVHHVQAPPQHVNISAMDPVRAVGLGTCGPPTLKRNKDEWYV